jgi:hypothetical protein
MNFDGWQPYAATTFWTHHWRAILTRRQSCVRHLRQADFSYQFDRRWASVVQGRNRSRRAGNAAGQLTLRARHFTTGLFVGPDTELDRRFADNPLVTGDPHLRFYAGALLETSEGLPLGTAFLITGRVISMTSSGNFCS